MTTDEYAETIALQGRWAAQVLSRLLPTWVEKQIISADSLALAITELENTRSECPEAGRSTFDDLIHRLSADYGSGHYL